MQVIADKHRHINREIMDVPFTKQIVFEKNIAFVKS